MRHRQGVAGSQLLRCVPLLLAVVSIASAQQAGRITTNFKDADITQITEAVAAATGKTIIIDPRVRAQVTMISSTPMSPAAFYEAYLAILQVHGFIAVPSGNIIKVLPDANARQIPSIDLPDHVSSSSDEIVTQVVDVKNISAAQLVPILRPLIPQYGQLAAYPASNILIISDRANNVNRIIRIIRRIDQVGDQDVEVIPLQNASSAEIVRVINSLYQGQAAAEGGLSVKVVADERSNSVLIGGEQSQRLRIRALIAHLDTPLESGGDTQVRYLRYADAEKIAPKLKEQITGVAQASAGAGGAGGAASPQAQAEKSAMVWADVQNNALVITAPPKIMHTVMSIIDKLDIRRRQVLVEAIIVEVNTDKTAEFGVNWAEFTKGNGTVPAGSFVEPVGGSSIVDLATGLLGVTKGTTAGSTPTAALPAGTTFAVGRLAAGGLNFAAMVRAIRGDADNNVLATPSTMTMDNQEAQIKVAEEVPFITGSFSNTGAGGSLTGVNPFQTVQRQEVGTILKVTPQIAAEGNAVVLKISIESSSVLDTSVSKVDITTSKRTITTNVLIDDGGVVVLGGLISNAHSQSDQRVPLLGSIPLLGNLFKTRASKATKTNLMMFIRPKILRDQAQAAYETDSKYNYMLDEQTKYNNQGKYEIPLLPGVKKPRLDPAPPMPPPGTDAAAGSPEEKELEAKKQAEADAAAKRRLQQQSASPPPAPATPPPQMPVTPPQSGTQPPQPQPEGNPK